MLTPFSKSQLQKCPLTQIRELFELAEKTGQRNFNAMALATAGKDGQPSVRFVLLKSIREDGFVFYTNYNSEKGRDIKENPVAEFAMYWQSLGIQVRARGTVKKTARDDSESYFHSRPLGSQISGAVSEQSRPLHNRDQLELKASELQQEHAAEKRVPCPESWGGYLVEPSRIEIWQEHPDRLHFRYVFQKTSAGNWEMMQLQP